MILQKLLVTKCGGGLERQTHFGPSFLSIDTAMAVNQQLAGCLLIAPKFGSVYARSKMKLRNTFTGLLAKERLISPKINGCPCPWLQYQTKKRFMSCSFLLIHHMM